MHLKKILAAIVKAPFKLIPLAAATLNVWERTPSFARFRWRILQLLEIEGKVERKHGCRKSVYNYWGKRYKNEDNDSVGKALEILEISPRKPTFFYIVDESAKIWDTFSTLKSLHRQSCKNIKIIFQEKQKDNRNHLLHKAVGLMGIKIVQNENPKNFIAADDLILDISPGDCLSQNALLEISLYAIDGGKKWELAYFDEDRKSLLGSHKFPFFKPDYSPVYETANDYIYGACVFKGELLSEIDIDQPRPNMDVLALLRGNKKNLICHIPEVLLHKCRTRVIPLSAKTINRPDAKTRDRPPEDNSLVSIIIPTKDNVDYLKRCVESILNKTSSAEYQIIIVDNNSEKPETHEYLENISGEKKIKILDYTMEFNYSAINNFAAKQADGEYLIFLNNDTEIISDDWLQRMKHWLRDTGIGCVGAKLLYQDRTIQHIGVLLGGAMGACHYNVGNKDSDLGYFGINMLPREISVMTGACIGIRKETFLGIGGFDTQMAVAFNDVQMCMRLREKGYDNLIDPGIQLFHYESLTRGQDDNEFKKLRSIKERDYFVRSVDSDIRFDPYYNRNFSLSNLYCLSFPPRTVSRIRARNMHSKHLVVLLGSPRNNGPELEKAMINHAGELQKKGYQVVLGIDKRINVSNFRGYRSFIVKNEYDSADLIAGMSAEYVIAYTKPFHKIAWKLPSEVQAFYYVEGDLHEISGATLSKEEAIDDNYVETYKLKVISSIEEFGKDINSSCSSRKGI